MSKHRVVVTGLGSITAIGHNVEEFWSGLSSGKNGIDLIKSFDTSEFSSKMAAEVSGLDLEAHFDKKAVRRYSKFVLFAILAAKEALSNAGLDVSKNPEKVGVEIGSGIGGIEILDNASKALHQQGAGKISPFTVPMMIVDMASGMVAIETGAKGPNSASVTACASSSNSIGNAFRILQRGDADAMIAGGSEAAVTPLGIGAFCAAKSLSTNNENPKEACRPFDMTRDGFVMGEGAGILVLETLEHAKSRGATILAELVGFGSSGDAYHMTAPNPNGDGAVRALNMALNDANLKPNAIDYINAHGTSTKLNDAMETGAIKKVFGDHAYTLKVSSTKSMTGHLLGAAGAIELIASILAIQYQMIPPTINYCTADPDLDLDYVPNKAVKANVNTILSNSFGFGGHNAVLIASKFN